MKNIRWVGWSMRVALAFFSSLAAANELGATGFTLWVPPIIAALTTAEAGLANLNQKGESDG